MPPATSPLDLTTLASAKNWAGVTSATDDQSMQDCITAFSAYALRVTGRSNADGSLPSASPLNSQVAFNEWYDGSGTDRLFLRNWPIVSVQVVTINSVTAPAATSPTVGGYVIDGSAKSIALRCGWTGPNGSVEFWNLRRGFGVRGFCEGIQNVNVQYTAGFVATPLDLEMCVRKVVALNWKRKGWIGQRSQAMAQGAGTISYDTWEMPPDCVRVLEFYTRRAIV